MKQLSFTLICLLLLSACSQKTETDSTSLENARLDSLFDAYYHFKMGINTLAATQLGDNSLNNHLPDYISEDFQTSSLKKYKEFRELIDEMDLEGLGETQYFSLQAMKWDCDIKMEGLQNELVTIASPMFDQPSLELMPLNQIFSLHLYFNQLAGGGSVQPFNTVKDYEDWLSRIHDFLGFLDSSIARMKEGIEQGIVHPKVIIEKMIPQLDDFTIENPELHIYYQPVKNMPASIAELDRERISEDYRRIIVEEVVPKFIELQNFLKNEYLVAGRESSGIGTLPNGAETYQYLIKYHTSTDMTADEIFNLGKSEVDRITAEMENVMKEIGFEGDLKQFFEHVRTRKELMPFSEPQEVIDHFNEIHSRMKEQLNTLFDLSPKAGFEVRRTEAFREASASAEYVAGSKDGSRPGVFYVPIPDVKSYNTLSDESLFLHEAIPGHHYQLSLQQENDNIPEFLQGEGMGVFVEGWALYSESLGTELGLFTDPYHYFGMLSDEIHRAIRLVVDAGMHAKGWTREEAIQYSLDHEAISEEGAIAEIERYMVGPGQALSYKIGQLKILELRERAKEALGDKFTMAAFHTQVLGTGSLPLVLLEEKIDRWIASFTEDSDSSVQ